MNLAFDFEMPKKSVTQALVKAIKEEDCDHNFYPTTEGMLDIIKEDMSNLEVLRYEENPDILDCGAGDGRALMYLTKGRKYAIEKARPLINAMHKDIFIVGTDFHANTLLDKPVPIIFVNPPYFEYAAWTIRIITEGNASVIYLIIPDRWKDNPGIQEAIELRGAKTHVIGEFDFLDAHRAARAKVNIVRIDLKKYKHGRASDPFDIWFSQNFKYSVGNSTFSRHAQESSKSSSLKENIQHEVVAGGDYIKVLENLYHSEMEQIIATYKKIEEIDAGILNELDVNVDQLKEGLKLKLAGHKNIYWKEFFQRTERITRRLIKKKREDMVNTFMAHTHVDFSAENAFALTTWAIKNANQFYDDQLCTTFERLVSKANIINYKSNQRVFGSEEWGWHKKPQGLDRFALDYRIVVETYYGVNSSGKPSSSQLDLINDLRVVADNLGYSVEGQETLETMHWEKGQGNNLLCKDMRTGKEKVLMAVRCYINGNIHIKLDQDFCARLCVEFGRLKGWLKDHQEASEEIGIDIDLAYESFGQNIQLGGSDIALIGFAG